MAGGKAAHGCKGLDVLEAPEDRGGHRLVILVGDQQRVVSVVHLQLVDNVGEVGLKEDCRRNAGAPVQRPIDLRLQHIERHKDILVCWILHPKQLPDDADTFLVIPADKLPLILLGRLRTTEILSAIADDTLHIVHHEGRQRQQIGVPIENLVEEVAAVVGGKLGMPNQTADLPNAERLQRALGIIYSILLLKVDGVSGHLIADQEHHLFLFQKRPQIQTLQMGAKLCPIGVVQIDVVVSGHVLAPAYIVIQILQLILGVDIRGQDRVIQILEEISGDLWQIEIHIIPKSLLRRIEGDETFVIKGVKLNRQLLKGQKIPAEEIGVLLQQLTILFIPGLEHLDIWFVKHTGHKGQALLPEVPPVVQISKTGI